MSAKYRIWNATSQIGNGPRQVIGVNGHRLRPGASLDVEEHIFKSASIQAFVSEGKILFQDLTETAAVEPEASAGDEDPNAGSGSAGDEDTWEDKPLEKPNFRSKEQTLVNWGHEHGLTDLSVDMLKDDIIAAIDAFVDQHNAKFE